MGSLSLTHWLLFAIILAVLLVPVARILRRAGFSRWWCILAVIPLVGFIGLWVFAFVPWPSIPEPARREGLN
jgi:predicted PurR-regulated permease PerM